MGFSTPWSKSNDDSQQSKSTGLTPWKSGNDRFNPKNWDNATTSDASGSASDFKKSVKKTLSDAKKDIPTKPPVASSKIGEKKGYSYGTIHSSGARKAISNADSKWRKNTKKVNTKNEARDFVDNSTIRANNLVEEVEDTARTIDKTMDRGKEEAKDKVIDAVTPGIPTIPGIPTPDIPNVPNVPDIMPDNTPNPDNSGGGGGGGGGGSQLGKVLVAVGVVGGGLYALAQKGGSK